MEEQLRKVVLGLGNLLQKDEGFGIHAIQALETILVAPGDLELIDGGVLGLNLLPLVEDCGYLLVLDAIDARRKPGTIIELARDEIPLYSGIKLSEHQVTFQDVMGLAYLRGKLPHHLHLIGVQPADLSLGMELSQPVANCLPEVIQRAINMLKAWGLVDR
jgi:hydrogenase maturation protease